jgi:hypothetical protein
MVEAGLVLTLIVMTFIGIVDVGQVIMLHQALTERVRAGARWAVVNTFDAQQVENVVLYNTSTPADGATPLLLLTPAMVTVERFNVDTPADRIEVRITNYPFRFFTPWIAGAVSARPIVAVLPAEGMGATE